MAPVLPGLFLVLLVRTISTTSTTPDAAVPLASLADLPSFVYYQFGRNFTDVQEECTEDIFRCPLCREGELYLFNRAEALRTNGSFEASCQQPPCPEWYSLWLRDRKCYRDYYFWHSICPPEMPPAMNLFGETFCGCGYWAATLLGSRKNGCHPLFTEGPCGRGALFVPVNDLVNFGQGQCLPSPCAKLLKGSNRMAEIRLPNGRTGCFEIGTQGPCKANYTLTIDEDSFRQVPHLSCARRSIEGYSATAPYLPVSSQCVPTNTGECVLPLRKQPRAPLNIFTRIIKK